jgi:hypothetical protein
MQPSPLSVATKYYYCASVPQYNISTRWINERSPEGWHFATSKDGWTSNDLGLVWLKNVFDPLTVLARRLRVAGVYSSLMGMGAIFELILSRTVWRMRSTFLLLCLRIARIYCNRLMLACFQPSSGFTLSRRVRSPGSWIELLSYAREKAMSKENILGVWHGARLWPALPQRVLRDLPKPHPGPLITHPYHAKRPILISLCYEAIPRNPLNYLSRFAGKALCGADDSPTRNSECHDRYSS